MINLKRLETWLSMATAAATLSQVVAAASNGLTLWYDRPASQWVKALPVGNGRLGAMVFGDPVCERIQLNEDTLWAGGPYDPSNPGALKALPEVRKLVFAGQYDAAHKLADKEMISNPRGQMQYQTLGDLNLEFDHPKAFTDYRRSLDLATAVSAVTYQADRVTYQREIFASHPDQLIIIRLTASKLGAISFSAGLSSPQEVTVTAGTNSLTMRGTSQTVLGIKGQVNFVGQAVIETVGGSITPQGNRLVVTNANSAIVKIAAATSYVNYRDVSGDPDQLVSDCLAEVAGKSCDKIKSDHIDDYRKLFDRVSLDLAPDPLLAAFPTDQRLKAFPTTADSGLVSLFFQYGRFPSLQINHEDTPELYRAAKRSLEIRGDAGTGWSLGWKINLWARLRDGDHAYNLIQRVFNFVENTGYGGSGGSYANMFGACPPFQIDSNFGAPSGICEMLMQSYRGRIIILPALPQVWPKGKITGLRDALRPLRHESHR